ncbi:DUF4261 domain-containing protein [Paenibacillus sp. CAU 1782]
MTTNQQQTALEAMTDWLSHEKELGRKPHKIEHAGEFMLHDMKYYLFKYKKKMLGAWLLGVCGGYESPEDREHCGHIFSEMLPYNPATAVEDATKMVEMIREYWMQRAAEYESAAGNEAVGDEDGENESGGIFNGFVLLNTLEFDREGLKERLQQDWGFAVTEQDGDEERDESDGPSPLVFEAEGCMLAISYIPAPVPDNEAVHNAGSNYLWPEAEEVAKTHVAHLIVAALPRESSPTESGSAYVKLASSCLRLQNAIGLYSSGTVFQPEFYQDVTEAMKEEDLFPLLNLVYFGLVRSENGVSGYTLGLKSFGKDEIEVLDSPASPSELREFLIDISGYVVEYDVKLRHGETIGFSEEQKLAITRSEGVNIGGDTLKIQFD